MWSQPLGTSICAATRPVEGSIRSTPGGRTVQTKPNPTARFCEPTAAGLSEKTFEIREMTWPFDEICQSELPLRAHREPNPATKFDGFGTSTARACDAGVGDSVELGPGVSDVGEEVEAVGATLVVAPVEHPVHRTTIAQRYLAIRMSASFSTASDQQRVTLDGERVVRRAYPWAPTVHALLRYVTANGFDAVPEPIDIGDGHETLRFTPGESGPAGWVKVVPDEGLRTFGRFLRRYHDATVGFEPPSPGAPWAFRSGAARPGEVICHGDVGPWNVVWRGVEPVGLLDFDFAGPGDRMLDVTGALEYVAPFCDDEECVKWRAYPEPPNRRRRIALFAEAYGLSGTDGLVEAVIERQELGIYQVRTLAARGFEPQRTWVRGGALDELAARVRWSREHLTLLE
jgi:hypothetical protein